MTVLMRAIGHDGIEILGSIDNFIVNCKAVSRNSFYKTALFKAAVKHLNHSVYINHYDLVNMDTNEKLFIIIGKD